VRTIAVVVGRLTTDAVTTLGTNVDGTLRRAEISYDTGGRPYLFTNYDASSGGSIVNQVQREFNGLGQLTKEYQAHSGAVNTGTSPNVQYAYSEMTGGANHSRPTSMTYPNGRVLDYVYGSGLDTTISRLTSLSSNSTTLESLSYLGLATVVKRAHSQPGVDLTYIKQSGESNGDAGDQYTGLDRFSRVVDQRWIKTSDGSHTDRFKYGYDRDSNRLYRENAVNAAFSELYHADGASAGYDNLNQLAEFQRGTLSDTNSDNIPDTVATSTRSQSWTMDGQGNWSSLNTDGSSVSRTHNKQNQVTGVGAATLTFDSNGNLTTDQNGQQYVYDAWNRLVTVKNSGGSTIASYKYDALGRRIQQTVSGTTTDMYFSAAWQVLEEQVSGTAKVQYVWSAVYIDALVERDRDADGNSGNGLEERFYVQQDANFNVTAIINTSGSVIERYVYDPYGAPTFLSAGWTGPADGYAWRNLHQGGKFDSTTGLYHFGARDESPTLGRWLEVDPLGFRAGDTNLYRDLGNSPANWTDPAGLDYDPNRPIGPGNVPPNWNGQGWDFNAENEAWQNFRPLQAPNPVPIQPPSASPTPLTDALMSHLSNPNLAGFVRPNRPLGAHSGAQVVSPPAANIASLIGTAAAGGPGAFGNIFSVPQPPNSGARPPAGANMPPLPAYGTANVWINWRPANLERCPRYCGWSAPHGFVVIQYSDGSVATYSFDENWNPNDSILYVGNTWQTNSPLINVPLSVIRDVIDNRKQLDNGTSLWVYPCWAAAYNLWGDLLYAGAEQGHFDVRWPGRR
jgi:RHS repeat-associated protein